MTMAPMAEARVETGQSERFGRSDYLIAPWTPHQEFSKNAQTRRDGKAMADLFSFASQRRHCGRHGQQLNQSTRDKET